MSSPRLAPDFRLTSGGQPLPAALRASVTGVSLQAGLEGVDRLEVRIANDQLRWLDHPALGLGRELALWLGYAPDGLTQLFTGDVVSMAPTFPADGMPTLEVAAHDRRERLQRGTKTRWFALAIPQVGNLPIPDLAVAAGLAAEGGLLLATDPVSLAISAALGGVEYALSATSPQGAQELVRKQRGETDLGFLARIAAENGWALTVDHGGPLAGNVLRFTSLLSHLAADLTFRYGESLIDFTPRLTKVGEIAAVEARVWVPEAKLELSIRAGWDWDRQALSVTVVPSLGLAGGAEAGGASEDGGDDASGPSLTLVDEAVDASTAPRLILGKLLPQLNARLTGSASVVGDPRLRPGMVVRLEGVGRQFGGSYRVTSVTHALDAGGFRTTFELRKEVWFDDGHLLRGLAGLGRLATAAAPFTGAVQ
jgi:phage protein D